MSKKHLALEGLCCSYSRMNSILVYNRKWGGRMFQKEEALSWTCSWERSHELHEAELQDFRADLNKFSLKMNLLCAWSSQKTILAPEAYRASSLFMCVCNFAHTNPTGVVKPVMFLCPYIYNTCCYCSCNVCQSHGCKIISHCYFDLFPWW